MTVKKQKLKNNKIKKLNRNFNFYIKQNVDRETKDQIERYI